MLKAQGKMMNEYLATHQDRSKNAMLKSIEAAFLSFVEELKADQAAFISDKILLLGGTYSVRSITTVNVLPQLGLICV